MPNSQQRMQILDRLERGEISTEEAADLLAGVQPAAPAAPSPMQVLEQLERGEINTEQAAQQLKQAAEQPAQAADSQSFTRSSSGQVEILDAPSPRKRPAWWAAGIAAGSLLAVLAAMWMHSDLQDGGVGLGFFCAWPPLLLGVLLIVLGGLSRQSPWASIRVQSHKAGSHSKRNIQLDMPLPLGMASRVVKFAGNRITGIELEDVETIVRAMEDARKSGKPIIIQARDDENDTVDIEIS